MIDKLEGRQQNDFSNGREGIVAGVFVTLLHEAQHRAEFKYHLTQFDPYVSNDPTHEAGFAFELKAFGVIGYENQDNMLVDQILSKFAVPIDKFASQLTTKSVQIYVSDETPAKMDPYGLDPKGTVTEVTVESTISDKLHVDTSVQKP